MARERRVIQIAEVTKGRWEDEDAVFSDLLAYEADEDTLKPTDRVDTGRSEALRAVAKRWGLKLEEVNAAASARGEMIEAIAAAGKDMPETMEIEPYARCVSMFRVIGEADRKEHGSVDYGFTLDAWTHWFSLFVGGRQ